VVGDSAASEVGFDHLPANIGEIVLCFFAFHSFYNRLLFRILQNKSGVTW
jgi:hypothetical protein